jgi:hypothetical protein
MHDFPVYGYSPSHVFTVSSHMSSLQGSSYVHLVEEGWQIFIVRQTSTISPS